MSEINTGFQLVPSNRKVNFVWPFCTKIAIFCWFLYHSYVGSPSSFFMKKLVLWITFDFLTAQWLHIWPEFNIITFEHLFENFFLLLQLFKWIILLNDQLDNRRIKKSLKQRALHSKMIEIWGLAKEWWNKDLENCFLPFCFQREKKVAVRNLISMTKNFFYGFRHKEQGCHDTWKTGKS